MWFSILSYAVVSYLLANVLLTFIFKKIKKKKKSKILWVYNTAVLLLTWLYLSLHATTFSLEDLNATSADSPGPQPSTQMGESRRDFPCLSAPWHVCPRRDKIKAGLLLQQKSLLTPEAVAPHLLCPLLLLCPTVEDSVMGCTVGVTAGKGDVGMAVTDGFAFLLYSAEDTQRGYDILGMYDATPKR